MRRERTLSKPQFHAFKHHIYGKGLDDHQMKMVQAIIRAEKMPDLKEHLRSIGVGGMTVYSVSGWSKKRELHLQWRGQPVSYDLVPKTKFEIVIPDEN